MLKALSLDLRTWVLQGVTEGSSHRPAAARYGVSAASVSRWRALERLQGDARPSPLGGDRRSARVEAQGALIKGILEATPDITVEELRLDLAERGHLFGYGTIQRFFRRHGLRRQKKPRWVQPVSATACAKISSNLWNPRVFRSLMLRRSAT
jgi:transposase